LPDTDTDSESSKRSLKGTVDEAWMRLSPGARTAAPWAALLLGVAFAGWAVMHYLTIQYEAESPPPVGPSPAGIEEGLPPPPSPGMISVRVAVRVRVAGSYVKIGTPLPRRVALSMIGHDGQPYEARFDRVGVWGMEAPPGEYRVSSKQKDLGDWNWILAGDCVKTLDNAENRYAVTLDLKKQYPTLDLTLY